MLRHLYCTIFMIELLAALGFKPGCFSLFGADCGCECPSCPQERLVYSIPAPPPAPPPVVVQHRFHEIQELHQPQPQPQIQQEYVHVERENPRRPICNSRRWKSPAQKPPEVERSTEEPESQELSTKDSAEFRSTDDPEFEDGVSGSSSDRLCNSPHLKNLIVNNMRSTAESSKFAIANVLPKRGPPYVIICSSRTFSFLAQHESEYCSARNSRGVLCYVFSP